MTDFLDAGVELDIAPFYPFRWRKEESKGLLSAKTYDFTEYSFNVFLAANHHLDRVTLFAKAIPGLYLRRLCTQSDYSGGFMSTTGGKTSNLHFGMKLMAGIDIPISDGWGVRLEGGRTFLRRDGFPNYRNPLEKLDSWNLRLGDQRLSRMRVRMTLSLDIRHSGLEYYSHMHMSSFLSGGFKGNCEHCLKEQSDLFGNDVRIV